MNDLIKQLKEKFVFGWISEELQDKCREIGRLNFERYDGVGWGNCSVVTFDNGDRLKLKADYSEEPDVLRVEIEDGVGGKIIRVDGRNYLYPLAPAVPPKGYEFTGFEYSDGFISNHDTRWVDAKGMFRHCSTKDALNWTTDHPVAALFEEGE